MAMVLEVQHALGPLDAIIRQELDALPNEGQA